MTSLPTTSNRHSKPPADQPLAEGVIEGAWRIVRRHWLLILATTLLTTALAVGFSLSREKQYTATASLLFGTASDSILDTGGFVDPNRAAATNEALLELPVVANETASRMQDRLSPAAIGDSVSVVADPSSNLIEVKATTPDPELSADLATAYSRSFISFRQSSDRDQIQDTIDSAERALATMTRQQRQGPEGADLRDRITRLEAAKSTLTGDTKLVQAASAPSDPSAPKPQRNGMIALVLGGLLGFGLAALRERWDRGIKSVDELEGASGWPVLARIPTSRNLGRGADLAPRGAEAEAFRLLRASLRYFKVNTDIRSLLITSARPGEGKSTTARRLAEAMAAMGDRVVLVQADMHRVAEGGRDPELVGRGLSGYLIGMDLEDVLVEVPVRHFDDSRTLAMLPSGPLPPNPSELLESDRMRELMDELEDRFDVVIVDSPPLPVLSDAITLLGHVSGVIVVSALGTTTRDDIRDVSRQLGLLGSSVLGIVANFVPPSQQSEAYYARSSDG